MKPKPKAKTIEQQGIGTMRLELAIAMDHERVGLAQVIDWDAISAECHPICIAPTTAARSWRRV